MEHQPLTFIDIDNVDKVSASLGALGITSRMTMEGLPGVALRVTTAANEIARPFGYAASGVKCRLN